MAGPAKFLLEAPHLCYNTGMRTIELHVRMKKPVLACGADVKGAFAVASGSHARFYEGFGDLGDADNLARYEKAVRRAARTSGAAPKVIACDLHPGYFSSRFAETYAIRYSLSAIRKVQHHEAHVASAIVDHAIKGSVIGVAFDGTGYGTDDNIWGGEFFVGNLMAFKRVAHFDYIEMPGGEAAIRQPWRMAASFLYHAFGRIGKREWKALEPVIRKRINAPLTSSVGRIFDAVGSIVLGKDSIETEAELPVELERIADRSCREAYSYDIKDEKDLFIIDIRRMIKGMVKDVSANKKAPYVSAKFHNMMAAIIEEVSALLRKRTLINKIVLTGGVFQNRFLGSRAVEALRRKGFEVYTHLNIPTGDGGIAIGQAAIANARPRCV